MWRRLLFTLLFSLLLVSFSFAQEFEPAVSSKLTATSLPANAGRLSPASVPADISNTLEKLVAAGEGTLRQGDSEVLVWNGKEYEKVGKATTVNRLMDTMKVAGWKYEVTAEENGVTFFALVKENPKRRGLMGFYAESDDTLVLAWTEVLPNGNQTKNTEKIEKVEAVSTGKDEITGIWRKGGMSMLQDRNTVTGATTPSNGMNLKFVFHPNGRFEFIGYLQSTMYGCTTDLFNDKQGKYAIKGTQITLIPSKNYWKNTYSCSPKSNKERNYTLENETYELKFKTDEYGKSNVCLTNAKGETCYRKEKE